MPPPPPPGPPPPPPPPPVSSSSTPVVNASGGKAIQDLIAEKQAMVEAITPVRPKTPPPREPDKLVDVHFDSLSCVQLFNKLQFGSQLLVLDCRDAQSFDKLHVRSAVNWDCVKHQSLLDLEEKVPRLFFRRQYHVILYDDGSSLESPSDRLKSAMDILVADQRTQQTVRVLSGGLAAFSRSYPFLVKGTDEFNDAEYPSEIIDGFLFLGNWETANNRRVLRDLEITRVVNATDSCDMPFKGDLEYLHCPLDDHAEADISAHFDDCLAFLCRAKKDSERVLIHCKMGMSRSPALVILWLMHKHNLSLREATELVRERRPYINPNPGFLLQLGRREVELFGETTIRFPSTDNITMATPYEWRQPDGSWVTRVVIR
ncbi:hypothetical protein PTSG_10981 [Salpingoeca rosetta]|uniref:protein-tyrosine-phosphatase n=1 Tax=Salpingoeca rosetta (strain ATCC 50818 / BSB-021) TaxID=946362 RepID=F2USC9_SALR5|nr:uncharacterized protein PTSG_10981 [Salpingoeca rosetta]EGD81038.1 hypothetical protein PTSG_10981 [Salpingoeca rosetta]|eukprot:XP_004987908.1 hypothetical protein PTSG_10981 [Salpingoeca rosetta]